MVHDLKAFCVVFVLFSVGGVTPGVLTSKPVLAQIPNTSPSCENARYAYLANDLDFYVTREKDCAKNNRPISHLAAIYHLANWSLRIGEPETAKRHLARAIALIAEIERIGLANIDDDGAGGNFLDNWQRTFTRVAPDQYQPVFRAQTRANFQSHQQFVWSLAQQLSHLLDHRQRAGEYEQNKRTARRRMEAAFAAWNKAREALIARQPEKAAAVDEATEQVTATQDTEDKTPVSHTAREASEWMRRRAEKVQAQSRREAVDRSLDEDYLRGRVALFEARAMPLSRLEAYVDLARYYIRVSEFGRGMETARKAERLVERLTGDDMLRYDDMGGGKTVREGVDAVLKLGPEAYRPLTEIDQRSTFKVVRMTVYGLIRQIASVMGDAGVEADYRGKVAALSKEIGPLTDERNRIFTALANKSMEAIAAQYGAAAVRPDPARQAHAAHDKRRRQTERQLLHRVHAEVLHAAAGNDEAALGRLLPVYERALLDYTPMLEDEDDPRFRQTFPDLGERRRFLAYRKKYGVRPRALAQMAFTLHRGGRNETALALLREAVQVLTHWPPAAFRTMWGTYRPHLDDPAQSGVANSAPYPRKTPFSWKWLEAAILVDLGHPEALVRWEEVVRMLEDPAQVESGGFMAIHYESYFNPALLTLARLYRKAGRSQEARQALQRILTVRETARASFTVEAHKLSYLTQTRGVYDRYLEAALMIPIGHLTGMERAKSRAMADLMAQPLEKSGDPLVRRIAGNARAAGAAPATAKNGRRGLTIAANTLESDLAELKATRPELYSAVAVNPLRRADLKAVAPPGTAVLSYYVADDGLHVTLYQDGDMTARKVAVPKMVLTAKVFELRRRMEEPTYRLPDRPLGIDVTWEIRGNGHEYMALANRTPLPLKVNRVFETNISTGPLSLYDLATLFAEDSFSWGGAGDSVPPGGTLVLKDYDARGESSGMVSSYGLRTVVSTNMGDVRLQAFRSTGPTGPRLTVIGPRSVSFPADPRSLHELLIAPLVGSITSEHLIVVPHDLLHFVPFEALKDEDGQYVVDRFAVSYAPSLTVLKYAKQRNPGRKASLVAFGDPLGDLKFARSEVKAIQALFPEKTVLTGKQVTVKRVLDFLNKGSVVHFASHAVFEPASPFDSSLLLHGAGGKPAPLTAAAILSQRFRPYLVTLSACDTGLARISGGDELLGLNRAFFVAGAPSLLTTLWKIDDESTAMLVKRFYANLMEKGMDKARALREAKLHLIKKGYKNPFHWAAFVLQGDWQ